MKIKAILLATVAQLLAVVPSHAVQTYITSELAYMTPAYLQISHPETGGQSAYVQLPKAQLTTTLEIDPDHLTARLSGSMGGSSATISYTTGVTNQRVNDYAPQFPQGPQPHFADGYSTVTVTLDLSAATFDSGDRALTWTGKTYRFGPGDIGTMQGLMTYSMTVFSEGESKTTTQSQNFTVRFTTNGVLDLTDYPTNSSIQMDILANGMPGAYGSAPNGFQSQFVLIPEPSSALLSAGILALFLRRKRQRC
ncbi:PEP-CTERM sorting domain-containing protein [Luteolibacter soli]|uniref:PEP-CTERM sorting domain-containing protein n=1 Tax=Luteolibacter soli TaxID=3135280 RepID=A0ABU9AYD1_9BACT